MRLRLGRRAAERPGLHAAAGTLVAALALTGVGIAGAAEDTVTVQARDNFWQPADVSIVAGDTVVWDFSVAGAPHDVASTTSNWSMSSEVKSPDQPRPPEQYTFTQPGEYGFVCRLHPATMTGTVRVGGGGGTPTPTATATVTATPTPTATPTAPPTTQPGPGGNQDHSAPPPSISAGADTVAPDIDGASAKGLRNRRLRVRFSLSEPAAVSLAFKRPGIRGAVRAARVFGHEGGNTVTVRSRRFKPGRRFVVQLRAQDALGNRSSQARDRVRMPRAR